MIETVITLTFLSTKLVRLIVLIQLFQKYRSNETPTTSFSGSGESSVLTVSSIYSCGGQSASYNALVRI